VAPVAAASGESVYKGGCIACHAAGVAGAPKFADKAAWGPRIAKGKPLLYEHALKGFNAMPAKGGNAALADADVKAAVDYMLAQAK
jgi:cytochrome c5